MNVQIIKQGDKPEWAVVPFEIYMDLVEKADMLQDAQDYDIVWARLERGNEELIPAEVIYAILDGENPIKTWREFRSIAQSDLAAKAGISIPDLSQLETGKRKGSLN